MMIHTTQEFLEWWTAEANNTAEFFGAIHDEDLQKRLIPQERSIGEILSLLIQAPKGLLESAGLSITGKGETTPPKTMSEFLNEYNAFVKAILKAVHDKWKDDTLDTVVSVHGEKWRRRDILLAILLHHIHHRGQLSILMRLAGHDTPPIYQI